VSIGQAQFQAVQRTFSQSTPADRDEALSLISLLQNTLDKTTFDKYSQEGEQMTLDQGVAYALAH
jgi:hypothetical protein